MKKYLSRKNFKMIAYDSHTFKPIYYYFKKIYYKPEIENDNFIIINKILFTKNIDDVHSYNYLFYYFYTDKEIRKLKLEKLNKI